MHRSASRSAAPCKVLPTPPGLGQPLHPVLHRDLSAMATAAQLISPGPCVFCPDGCQGGGERGEGRRKAERKTEREREEGKKRAGRKGGGSWMGLRRLESLEVKERQTSGVCV